MNYTKQAMNIGMKNLVNNKNIFNILYITYIIIYNFYNCFQISGKLK